MQNQSFKRGEKVVNDTCSKLFAVTFWRLAGSRRCYYWTRLHHPVCVYGKNASQAILNAIKAVKQFPIITPSGHQISYVFNPEESDLDIKNLKLYIFWVIGKRYYCIVPASSKSAAKLYLHQKGVLVYDGRVITAKLLKVCQKDKCSAGRFCQARQVYSQELCNPPNSSTLDGIATTISCKSSLSEHCPLCSEELSDPDYCNCCGWDKTYGGKGSPHIDYLPVN